MELKAAMETVPPEHKATLEAEGVDVSSFVQTLLEHGCDIAPGIRVIIPIVPLSAPVKMAILGVVNALCPL